MLIELHIEDLGVISSLDLVVGSGLTVFTGETGAGKTMLVEAISLLVGGRADATMVRAGALDSLGVNRATLMHQLPGAMQAADQSSRAKAAGSRKRAACRSPASSTRSSARSSLAAPAAASTASASAS